MPTFRGHLVPALGFFTVGVFFLSLTFVRCRKIMKMERQSQTSNRSAGSRKNNNSSTFCELHIPENNHQMLFIIGIIGTIGPLFAASITLFHQKKSFSVALHNQLPHLTMMMSFFFVGAICLGESRGIVASDSSRKALALAFLMNYLLMNEHAMMKTEMADIRIHVIQSYIHLVAFLISLYSVYDKKSFTAYVLIWYTTVLDGMWLFTAGLTQKPYRIDIHNHIVAPVFCLEALFLGFVLLLIIVIFLPGWGVNNNEERHKYEAALQVEEDNDECDLILS